MNLTYGTPVTGLTNKKRVFLDSLIKSLLIKVDGYEKQTHKGAEKGRYAGRRKGVKLFDGSLQPSLRAPVPSVPNCSQKEKRRCEIWITKL